MSLMFLFSLCTIYAEVHMNSEAFQTQFCWWLTGWLFSVFRCFVRSKFFVCKKWNVIFCYQAVFHFWFVSFTFFPFYQQVSVQNVCTTMYLFLWINFSAFVDNCFWSSWVCTMFRSFSLKAARQGCQFNVRVKPPHPQRQGCIVTCKLHVWCLGHCLTSGFESSSSQLTNTYPAVARGCRVLHNNKKDDGPFMTPKREKAGNQSHRRKDRESKWVFCVSLSPVLYERRDRFFPPSLHLHKTCASLKKTPITPRLNQTLPLEGLQPSLAHADPRTRFPPIKLRVSCGSSLRQQRIQRPK